MAFVEIDTLRKRYGSAQVIHDISLGVGEGEFVALVGPSGCGKSTTLRMLAGLEDITAGTISIAGRVVNDLHPSDRGIAMVFQSYALYPHMTVAKNMSFAMKVAGQPKAEIEARVAEAARILHLEAYLNRRPADLSGGQRQRVAMGRAIVRRPDVFLFDEPLSNLDAKLRNRMRTEIRRIHDEVGATTVYVTHDQVEAMTLADRIVIMRDGHIEQVGTPNEIFEAPDSDFVASFIGTPPMNLVPATANAEGVTLPDGTTVPLDTEAYPDLAPGTPVTFGLRPDDIAVAGHGMDAGRPWSVRRPVSLSEPLGGETLVFFPFGGGEASDEEGGDWIAKMFKPRALRPGEEVELRFDLDRAHLFDRETGQRLARRSS